MQTISSIILKGKLNIKKLVIVCVMGLLTQIAASFILTVILEMIPGAAEMYMQNIGGLLVMTPAMILSVCVVAPLTEEVFFRGLILGGGQLIVPFYFANAVQAVLFGIYHRNLIQGIYAFLLGLFIGYIMKIAGGIVYTIVFHASLNLAGLYIDKVFAGVPDAVNAAAAVVSLILIYGGIKIINKNNNH